MHELAVTESILEIACKYAENAKATRVTDIYLVIGNLSSIVDDCVSFYWDMISKNTVCENAKLHFKRIPATLTCLDCNQQYTLDGELTPCPHCHSPKVRVISGDESNLDSIEIQR